MKTVDVVFVILHYMAVDETMKSVNYIAENIDTHKYHIVIVDNASGNESGEELKAFYLDRDDVTVLINKENLGFAKGNNVGFRYAKKTWNPDYIVLMNNDVYLLEKAFMQKTAIEYAKSHFAVMGPMILTKDGTCDANPLKSEFTSIGDIDQKIRHYKKDLRRYRFRYASLYYKLAGIKGILVNYKKKNKDFYNRAQQVKLHGCFLVFSQEYISSFDGLDESTFLFWEEEFLYKHMLANGKVMAYNPDIVVLHLEDASTDYTMSGRREKMIFMLEHYLDSLESLKQVYLKYEEKDGEHSEKNTEDISDSSGI